MHHHLYVCVSVCLHLNAANGLFDCLISFVVCQWVLNDNLQKRAPWTHYLFIYLFISSHFLCSRVLVLFRRQQSRIVWLLKKYISQSPVLFFFFLIFSRLSYHIISFRCYRGVILIATLICFSCFCVTKLAGAVILGVGIWVKVDNSSLLGILEKVDGAPPQLSQLANVAYVLIGIGAFLLVIGFLGCCGAIKESRCMLLTVS